MKQGDFKKFPEQWPYVNQHGVTIEKSEIDSFVAELYKHKSHRKQLENRGVELCGAILWAMDRVTMQNMVPNLAYSALKRVFKVIPRLDRDWRAALIVKRRNALRTLARKYGRPTPSLEELREQEKEMFRVLREEALEVLHDDSLRDDLKLLRFSYGLHAKPGESLEELAEKPLNRQAEKIAQIRKRFIEEGWIKCP